MIYAFIILILFYYRFAQIDVYTVSRSEAVLGMPRSFAQHPGVYVRKKPLQNPPDLIYNAALRRTMDNRRTLSEGDSTYDPHNQ